MANLHPLILVCQIRKQSLPSNSRKHFRIQGAESHTVVDCPEATHKYINSQISILELILVTYDLSYTTLQWTRHQSLGFPLKYMICQKLLACIQFIPTVTGSKAPFYTIFNNKDYLTCDHPLYFNLKIYATGSIKYILLFAAIHLFYTLSLLC